MSFANPLFLWGLLGLAVPVLLHLINRDLFRPVRFPSIRFILKGKLPVERKRRLRDLLLLALRMLLFAAIITALARPQWQPSAVAAAQPTDDSSELVLLVDASASMSGWDVWENTVARAEAFLAEHGSAPAGLVISGSGPILVEPLTDDPARLQTLLNDASPQLAAGDHRDAFRQALQLFGDTGERTLAVISDFQQADWSATSLPQVPSGINVEWIQIEPETRENVGILHARTLPLADGRRQVLAGVKNFGTQAAERTITLQAGDDSPSRVVTLAPGETQSVSFILEEPSTSQAVVTLDPDGFPADNRFFLWLSRPPPIRVLVVAPTEQEPEKMEEAFFISRALGTQTETEWLHFAVQLVQPGMWTAEAVQDVRAVFLLGAAPYLSDAEWTLLHDHANQGARLLFTPGKAPARQVTLLAEQGFVDLSYEGIAGAANGQLRPHSIDWVLPDSSIDLLFRDEAATSLSHVSIYKYVQLDASNGDATVLLRTTDEDPLLIRKALGSGVVFASAFAFQTSWTDLPVTTAFLPIIRDLVTGDLPPDYGIVNLDTGPATTPIASNLNLPADAPLLANIDPLSPGVSVIANTPVVLNAPRSESLPELANPVDLQTAVAPTVASVENASDSSDGDPTIPLWPWLALAALLFFILEMPLAAKVRRLRQAERQTSPPVATEATVQNR